MRFTDYFITTDASIHYPEKYLDISTNQQNLNSFVSSFGALKQFNLYLKHVTIFYRTWQFLTFSLEMAFRK